jgi:hypothetical protein
MALAESHPTRYGGALPIFGEDESVQQRGRQFTAQTKGDQDKAAAEAKRMIETMMAELRKRQFESSEGSGPYGGSSGGSKGGKPSGGGPQEGISDPGAGANMYWG